MNLHELDNEKLSKLSEEDFRKLLADVAKFQADDIKENQLLYYRPVSEIAKSTHASTAHIVGIGGGNRSSKTETHLAELLTLCTGVVPLSIRGTYPLTKLRGPVQARIICESLTTVLHPIMLPKLQWWRWSGADTPGGQRGHWGWIPRTSLIDGSWDKSWSEKIRLLRVYCRDPENPDRILGESTIQFMSHDQDPTDFSSGDCHVVLFDEPPKYAIFRENQARVMAVKGRLLLAMTWPDDPSIPVDWLFDEVYDKAQPGPMKDPEIEWYEFATTDNPNIDQGAVQKQMGSWSSQTQQVRIYGKPLRFSNRIHPLFTDTPTGWCFKCGTEAYIEENKCAKCQSGEVTTYCHVEDFQYQSSWPVIFLLDPHPRKPHMMSWVAIDPYDDLWQVADLHVDGHPTEVRLAVDDLERRLGMRVAQRMMDPNMGASAPGVDRGVTWADEFRTAGLSCWLADDSDVGRSRVNEYLKPDKRTLRPRLHIHPRCSDTIFQMKRYCWAEHKQSLEKEQKQIPKDRYDDHPTLLKYALNMNPSFSLLKLGAPVISRGGRKRGY